MQNFCENCHDMVAYSVKEEKKSKNIKGVVVKFIGKEAYCNECGDNIFVSALRDYNLARLDEAYRKIKGLISVSEIEEVLEKYDIGKRPLSSILGWGEGTLSRYIDGDMPSKEYSDVLKKILDNPDFLKERLEENKDKVSMLAYKKVMKAIDKCEVSLSSAPFEEGKIDDVVRYIISKAVEVTPLAVQKLLYFSQGFYRAFTGDFLFKDDCEAWVHGPVYRNVYDKYKEYGYNPIDGKVLPADDITFTTREKEILDSIVKSFGCYSGKILEMMTHAEEPWIASRNGLRDDESSNNIIDRELIARYFVSIKDKYNMLNGSDIKDYTVDLFNKLT